MLSNIILSMHVDAMEEINPSLKFPTELLDLIAQFLPFYDIESDEEFIKRTQILKLQSKNSTPEEFNWCKNNLNYIAYSPDNVIIAVSRNSWNSMEDFNNITERLKGDPHLYIFNRKNDQKKCYNISSYHQKLAVSSDENLVATMYSQYESGHPCEREDHLTIANLSIDSPTSTCRKKHSHIAKKKSESFSLPPDETTFIAFNKQGTHIIAHSKNSQYKIFTLTINTPHTDTDNKKTFAKYCTQRGICKNLTHKSLV